MPRDSTRPRREVCVDCQYPLLRLDGFEGDSSHDAPGLGRCDHDSTAVLGFVWDLVTLPWHWAEQLWRGGRHRSRRKQVARLREDILPQEPHAMICPQCLRVAFPDELRG